MNLNFQKRMMRSFSVWFTVVLLILISCTEKPTAKENEFNFAVIPKPLKANFGVNKFTFNDKTVFVTPDRDFEFVASVLKDKFNMAAGWNLKITQEQPADNYVIFVLDTTLNSEAYRLSVNPSSITIEAADNNGFIYGLQTLRMLLPVEIESKNLQEDITWNVPVVKIEDSPRYQWRGLMLDVSRHFFDIAYIKQTLDRMAMLKLNTFHWHLIDDQGWRIEIKKYPKLTEVGAFRVDQEDKHWNARALNILGQEATYGGYYTQNQIKEVVQYASNLGITVVPEIEMPAHVMSAIAAYPELSCFEKDIMVPSGGVWPITEIYCAGKDSTYKFLEDVIDEVVTLFPSPYIHVGGDEATKTNWKKCPHCKKRMKDEKLANVEELQSYFIARMEKYIGTKGRNLIGWDEILEGGIAPGAAVMSWRGTEGGIEASADGHEVVMTPGDFCYFDKYQGPQNSEPLAIGGYIPLTKVYEFDPIVVGMSEEQEKYVLGGQANLWSEYITTSSHSEYMLFPRLVALSEALWISKTERNWNDFAARLKPYFKRLSYMDVNFAKSVYTLRDSAIIDMESRTISVGLFNEFKDSKIEYAISTNTNNLNYISYDEPIVISSTATIHASVVEDGIKKGIPFEQSYDFHKGVGARVIYNTMNHDSYNGQGNTTLVNVLRGSKNFHDGQWQAWLNEDVDVTLDLGKIQNVQKLNLGFLQNQGPDIYFPTSITVFKSTDNITFEQIGFLEIPVLSVNHDEIKDFNIEFNSQDARYIKIIAKNGPYPENEGGAWLFMDELKVY